jgi:hypothetical protein
LQNHAGSQDVADVCTKNTEKVQIRGKNASCALRQSLSRDRIDTGVALLVWIGRGLRHSPAKGLSKSVHILFTSAFLFAPASGLEIRNPRELRQEKKMKFIFRRG